MQGESMDKRVVAGYALLLIGMLGSIVGTVIFLRVIASPPSGDGLAGILAGVAAIAGFLIYSGSLIFIIPGTLLVRKHGSKVRRVLGIALIVIGIWPFMLVLVTEPSLIIEGGILFIPSLVYVGLGGLLTR